MLLTSLVVCLLAQPLVIAHRGASAALPEHTLEAYTLAHAQGADFVEPDVVLTKDNVLVCCHDLTVTNEAAMRALYPDRSREDGKWYVIDFTLAELRATGDTIGRNEMDIEGTSIATLDEMIALIQRLNEVTGREVGIIPEPKSPTFHREEGLPIEPVLTETLHAHGYATRQDRAIIQCFDLASLERMREMTDLRLVFLFSDPVEDEVLDDVATFADGIGPSRKLIIDEGVVIDTHLIGRAQSRSLTVYPWTFGSDAALTARFFDLGVDGLFTDNPDVGVAVRLQTAVRVSPP